MITNTRSSLLESVRGGSERAWQELYRLYAPLVLSFAKRLDMTDADAGDVVQETFIAVHRAFSSRATRFDRERGRFRNWLRAIAERKARDMQRRRRRELSRIRSAAESGARLHSRSDLDRVFDQEWRRSQLTRALESVAQRVEPRVFQAFELYAVHGMPPGRVARLLGMSRNAVYISKMRVLGCLRSALAALEEEEEEE